MDLKYTTIDYDYCYPFSFPFNYEKMLEAASSLSKKQVRHARIKNDNQSLPNSKRKVSEKKIGWAKRLTLTEMFDDENAQYIVNECKKLLDKIGSKKYTIILVEYDSESFLDWHIDTGNASRINCILTDNYQKTPIRFRNSEYSFRSAVVNVSGKEHMYDNRGKEKRILLTISIPEYTHHELIQQL